MKNRAILCILTLAFMTIFGTACGPSNTVKLTYPAKDSSLLPAPSAPTVAVVLFEDKRPHTHLGTRKNSTTFAANVAVPEWVSRSFADALNRHGLQVSYAETADIARMANPKYIVTGKINHAELKEVSMTELRATMQVDIVLAGPQGRILTEGLSASQSESGIIVESTAEKLLLQTVQELIKPGASKVSKTILK